MEYLLEFLAGYALVLYKILHYPVQRLPLVEQHLLRPLELLLQYPAYLLIHLGSHLLGIAALVSPVLRYEHLGIAAQEHGAYLVAHAELYDHAAGKVAGVLQVAYGAGAYIVKGYALGHTASHTHGYLVKYLAPGNVAVVVVGHGHGVARRLTSGYYGYLVYRIAVLHLQGYYGVSRLVIGGDALILLGNYTAALFGAHNRAGYGLLQLHHGYLLLLEAGRKYGSLVEHVFKISAGHAAGALCQHPQIHVLGEGLALGVNLEYGLPSLNVGIAHGYLPVKPARTQQCGVEYVWAVSGGKHYYAFVYRKAVHLHQ